MDALSIFNAVSIFESQEGMIMRARILIGAILVSVAVSVAGAVEPGSKAPLFELQTIEGEYIDSQQLFTSNDRTFLAFWSSQCSHCVESLHGCEEFHRDYGGGSVQVVGINTDDDMALRLHEVLEMAGVTFIQLSDDGGAVAGEYGIPHETFALYLVDRSGAVVARSIDPEGDIAHLMENMLQMTPPEMPAAAPEERDLDIRIDGDGRIRYLGIDTRGDDPVGPYGEQVSPGNHVQYRFMLELSKRLGKMLEVGALLRVSNEGEEVLESGPDYLGSEWGSAYAALTVDRLRIRLGYYAMSMTPLTLMRWDWDDNPRIGGDAGCGCGPTAGTLLIESLEELGPSLTFEGAQLTYGMSGVEIRAFYAIPRRANETDYTAYRFTGEAARYSLEIYGAEARFQRHDSRTGRFWRAGVHFIRSFEDERTVDFKALGYPVSDLYHESNILSLSWEAPLLSFASLRGEWLLLSDGSSNDPDAPEDTGKEEYEGGGGVAGILLGRDGLYELKCDYVRIEPGFFSPFAALSYEPNREGVRAAGSLFLLDESAAVSVFYKRSRELEVYADGEEKEQLSLFGLSLDLEHESGYGGYLGYLDRGSWRTGESRPFDAWRRAYSGGLRYRLERSAYIELRYERVETSNNESGEPLESETNLFGLYLKAEF
jgi:peroxiredoxin